MKLLTKELRKALPELYSQDGKGEDAIAQAHYFHPYSTYDFYPSEFDGQDTFFGLVKGLETELGYFSLNELEGIRLMGLPMERDLHWTPKPLKDCRHG